MYFRYFMWNFAGRQNDQQGFGGILKGNWISGIPFLDAMRLGSQKELPESMKNDKTRNVYFLLPLILGILGISFHYSNLKRDFWVVMLLFFMTGIAIVIYLNQTPLQPRERDYAYAGSFYAFAIWIGLGTAGLCHWLNKKKPMVWKAAGISAICIILVPGIMAAENWKDHDRSGRYTARDLASNYLNSCPKNGILFTIGDNDTFPLWYVQEVEGIRTDVRVCNTMLLNTEWYIDQMKRKAYESEPLPINLSSELYDPGKRNWIYLIERVKDYVPLKDAVEFVASERPETKSLPNYSERIDYIPAKKFVLKVDRDDILSKSVVDDSDTGRIVPELHWSISSNQISKADFMILDMLVNNDWERPMAFVNPSADNTLGLQEYLELNGFAFKVVPVRTANRSYLTYGKINSDSLYNKLMHEFKWGRMNAPDVHLDEHTLRLINSIRIRHIFNRLAETLIRENKKDSALRVLDKSLEIMPHNKVPYDVFSINQAEYYYLAGDSAKGSTILNGFSDNCIDDLQYFTSLDARFLKNLDYEVKVSLQLLNEMFKIASAYHDQETADKIYKDMNFYSQRLQTLQMAQ